MVTQCSLFVSFLFTDRLLIGCLSIFTIVNFTFCFQTNFFSFFFFFLHRLQILGLFSHLRLLLRWKGDLFFQFMVFLIKFFVYIIIDFSCIPNNIRYLLTHFKGPNQIEIFLNFFLSKIIIDFSCKPNNIIYLLTHILRS